MYKTPEQSRQFMNEFVPLLAGHTRDEIVICPPFVDIAAVVEMAAGTIIEVGAQNMYWEKEGAFTAEVSGEMLIGAGCKWVIIGHSERRQYFGETDDTVNRRLKVSLEAGLAPIVCIGEVKEEREAGVTGDVLRRQCSRAFSGISARKAAKMAIAYEPVWAIGTGLTATPEMANEAHQMIRQEAANVFGEEYAQRFASSTAEASSRKTLTSCSRRRKLMARWSAEPASTPIRFRKSCIGSYNLKFRP